MKNNFVLAGLIMLCFVLDESVFAQDRTLKGARKMEVIHELEKVQSSIDSCHYHVTMLFKEFGGDTFEVKKFDINYRSNISNQLYGYDFEIGELREQDTLIIMAVSKTFYVVITGVKKISESELPDKIAYGSYFDNIRTNYIISEVLLPFVQAPLDDLSIVDSMGSYYLRRRMNDFAARHLVVHKKTYLPLMWSSVIRGQGFDLTQTLEVHFDFDQDMYSLPSTAFSVERYLTGGYEHIVAVPDTSPKPPIDHTLSIDKREMLLNYRFVLPDDDTRIIIDSKAEYIVLDFWYASCLPCLRTLPDLNNLDSIYAEAGLEILGINCFDEGTKENLALKMRERNIHIPLLFGSRDLVNALKISSFPTYYLVTPDRRLQLIDGGIEEVKRTIEKIFD